MNNLHAIKIDNNLILANAVVERCEQLGWVKDGLFDLGIASKYGLCLWNDGTICHFGDEDGINTYGKVVSLDDLFNTEICKRILAKKVVLNSEYSAEITDAGIRVGCQNFSFAAFDKLAVAIKEFRSNKHISYNKAKLLPVGTKVKVIKASHGAYGCNGLSGVITDKDSVSGTSSPIGINIKVDSGIIWNIGCDDEIKLEVL